jgi:DNA-binding Lrp family transcriptional regulator
MWHMLQPDSTVDELDRQIVAALQVNGRASWRTIAAVLGEPERSVARRGTELIRAAHVRVKAVPHARRVTGADQHLVKVRCTPGSASAAARGLARWPETSFSYVLTGTADVVVGLSCTNARLADLVATDIGSVPGILSASTATVLKYFRELHEWRPDVLDAAQNQRLQEDIGTTSARDGGPPTTLTETDRRLLTGLVADGRSSFEDLGRLAAVSLQTASRRVEQMRRDGVFTIRAVFDPAVLGLHTHALLWVRAAYPALDDIGAELARSSAVRYAAAVTGEHQLAVDVVVADHPALYEYLRSEPWVLRASGMETSPVVEVLMLSGLPMGRLLADVPAAWRS